MIGYEDDELRIYSARQVGTFADQESEDFYELGDDADSEVNDDVETGTSAADLESLEELRRIERRVDYDAIDKTDYDSLYQPLSESDRTIVGDLRDFFGGYGVLEKKSAGFAVSEDTVSAEDLFEGSALGAVEDAVVNPEITTTFDDEDETIHDLVAGAEDGETLEDFLAPESGSSHGRGVGDDSSADEDAVVPEKAREGGRRAAAVPGTASAAFSHSGAEMDGQGVSGRKGMLGVEDVIRVKRMLDLGKLDDEDIASVMTGLTREDIAELRRRLT